MTFATDPNLLKPQGPMETAQPSTDEEDLLEGQAGDMLWRSDTTADPRGGNEIDPETGLPTLTSLVLKGQDPAQPEQKEERGTGNATVDQLIKEASTQLGVKYVYGARQWGKALDCSGFTQQAFARIGIQLGGDTYTQVQQGQAVEGGLANARPGDLIFTVGDKGMRVNGHVGIYLGNGQVINAPRTGDVVRIQDWSNRGITAIRRYF